MTDQNEPKYPSVRLFSPIDIPQVGVTTTVSTAIGMYGSEIWKNSELFPKRPPPDHPIYSLVGQVASAWSHIDHQLDILIWELADVSPQAGACITAQIAGTFGRFKAVIALLTFHQQKTNRNLQALIDRATELSNKANPPGEMRHRTVHDPWYEYSASPDQIAQFRAMPHKNPQYGIDPVELKRIQDALAEIEKFSHRVEDFRKDVLATLVTSR